MARHRRHLAAGSAADWGFSHCGQPAAESLGFSPRFGAMGALAGACLSHRPGCTDAATCAGGLAGAAAPPWQAGEAARLQRMEDKDSVEYQAAAANILAEAWRYCQAVHARCALPSHRACPCAAPVDARRRRSDHRLMRASRPAFGPSPSCRLQRVQLERQHHARAV